MKNRVQLKSGRYERLDVNRFMKNVYPEPNTGCWIWSGRLTKKGYGNTNKMLPDGRMERGAHRISYYLFNGPFDFAKLVCHTCDNAWCVNPDHLWLGTTQENTNDMKIKGRAAKGEKSPHAKLTTGQVREIRQKYSTGLYTYRGLIAEYGQGAKGVISNKTWRHVK